MAAGMHALILVAMEELEGQRQRRHVRRRLRDAQNPFEIREDVFQDTFRISREMARDLVSVLRPRLHRSHANALSVECQVLTAVKFFTMGSYQQRIGCERGLAVSQPSVSRCVRDVTAGIVALLLPQWVQFPTSAAARVSAKTSFFAEGEPLHGVIGAIDCTHIHMIKPHKHEQAFINNDGTHSLNVQMICDSSLKILNVNARFGGSCKDAFIWSVSSVHRLMERWFDRGERNTWLVGDSGYPLEPWLLTPLSDAASDTPEFRYNQAVCKCRSSIERCFSLLKGTWRCLSRQRQLLYHPEKLANIVKACAVLHNMRLRYKLPQVEAEDYAEICLEQPAEELKEDGPCRLAEGKSIQTAIIRTRFQ